LAVLERMGEFQVDLRCTRAVHSASELETPVGAAAGYEVRERSSAPATERTPRPLLVTGAHRSGTTWVGITLAADPGITYLTEPFNVDHLYPGMCAARFPRWFTRITAETAPVYEADIARMLRFKPSWRDAARASAASPRASLRAARLARTFRRARERRSRALMKDPIALFSAEWLADTFDMDVVVLIRHPAAFAASIARLSWRFDFRSFLSQTSLMDSDLAPFAGEIESAARRAPTLIDEAALLWKCIYATVDRYRAERPAWTFVRHEDLLTDPAGGFRAICEHTGAPFSAPVAQMLRRTSSPENPVDAPPGTAHSLMRDSRAMTRRWRQMLEPGDVAAIRASVEQVASRYYTDADWLG
jgi:hypothetical protein